MELKKALLISASGMEAQSQRMRIIAENLANSDSLGTTPGADPFRRKTVSFKNVLDRTQATTMVKVSKIGTDTSEFDLRYDPGHPAANADGYVKTPNVKALIEMADMREAQRSYEANLNVIDAAKGMLSKTVDLLR